LLCGSINVRERPWASKAHHYLGGVKKLAAVLSGARARGGARSPELTTRGLWLVAFVFAAFSAIYGYGITDKGNNLAPKRRFWSHGHRGKVTRTSRESGGAADHDRDIEEQGFERHAPSGRRRWSLCHVPPLPRSCCRSHPRAGPSEIGLIRSAAALLVRSGELQAAAVRNEDLDGDELIRLTSEARRLLHCLRKPALPEPEPMSIEEHLAAYGAVKPRQAREPSRRGRRVPPPASVTRWVAAAGSGEGLRATMRRPDPWMPPAGSAETRIAA